MLFRSLKGGRLTAAHRRGKTMWCDTVTADGTEGPLLAIHLGMGGRIFVTAPSGDAEGGTQRSGAAAPKAGQNLYAGGDPHVGGMPTKPNERPNKPEWDRVTIRFDDGGSLRLFDKRRLGRVHLDPDLDALGPDAEQITREQFRDRVGRGTSAIKARLLDQSVLAGVGNLLADEVLWQARLDPRRAANSLGDADLDELRRDLRKAIRHAVRTGGVHHGEIIAHRGRGEHCPRCGADMARATVGGRTTWYCPAEQHV